jgi:hypothetical protein
MLRACLVALCLFAFSCSKNVPPGGGTAMKAGLGDDCSSAQCRAGLVCDSATHRCKGGGMTADGAACVIGVECMSGQCGPNGDHGQCVEPGTGMVGADCKGDADCATGLRCGFDGQSLFPKCVTPGTGDTGHMCATSIDCAQDLYCVMGACTFVPLVPMAAPHGNPPVVPDVTLQWQGASCPDEKMTSPVTALWEVPRDSDPMAVKQDFFRLPFPNDAARAADGSLDFSRFPKDPSPVFGFDAVGRYLDVLKNEPFGGYGTVIFRFDGQVKFDGFNAQDMSNQPLGPQTRIVDLTPGQRFGTRRGLFYQLNGGGNRYVCGPWFAIRPFTGDGLPAGTYAIILLTHWVNAGNSPVPLTDEQNAPVQSSPDLQAMLGSLPPTDSRLTTAYAAYAPLRTYLAQQSITPANVLVASVFTVGDTQRLVKSLAESVAALPPPTSDGWVKCGSGTPSPCPDSTGVRACGNGSAGTFDEWHALIDVPIFQQGEAPYLTPAQGGGIDPDGGVLPPVRREKVCAALTTPKGTPPAAGWPLILYAHGTGGSFRSHAADGSGAALATFTLDSGTLDGGALPGGYAVLGFDQVGHGPRRGDAGQDASPNDIVFNFANPASARGTMAQGAADLFGFAAYAKSIDTADAGLPALDTRRLMFWGHSQGATEGALFLANDRTVHGTVLSGASASLTDALISKRSPVDIADGIWIALSESTPAAVGAFHPVLSMLQTWSDVVDPVNFGRNVVVVPASADGGVPVFARDVFQVWGKNDTFTAQPVQSTFAAAAGLSFVGPQLDDFDAAPTAFASGNVFAGPFKVTAAFRQYDPGDAGYDGHFVVYSNAQARSDALKFILRSASGDVPTVPEP